VQIRNEKQKRFSRWFPLQYSFPIFSTEIFNVRERNNFMQTAKQEVNKLLKRLPNDCTLEDIQYHLYVIQKIERGLKDVEEGRVYTQEQVEKKMAKWLKK